MTKLLTSTAIFTFVCLVWSVYDFFADNTVSSQTAYQGKSFILEPAIERTSAYGLRLQAEDGRGAADRQSSSPDPIVFFPRTEMGGQVVNATAIVSEYPVKALLPALQSSANPAVAGNLNVGARAVREVFAEDVLARRTLDGTMALKLAEGEDYAN